MPGHLRTQPFGVVLEGSSVGVKIVPDPFIAFIVTPVSLAHL